MIKMKNVLLLIRRQGRKLNQITPMTAGQVSRTRRTANKIFQIRRRLGDSGGFSRLWLRGKEGGEERRSWEEDKGEQDREGRESWLVRSDVEDTDVLLEEGWSGRSVERKRRLGKTFSGEEICWKGEYSS